MVVVPLKSQFVSLIVTLISGLAELLLFGALLGFNKYSECIALRKGHQVSVRLHRFRAKFLAVLAMVVFIVLEVIMSFFSDPAKTTTFQSQKCLALDQIRLRTGQAGNLTEEDFVLIKCISIKGTGFAQRAGNYSFERKDRPGAIRCSKSAIYEFPNQDPPRFNITGARRTGGSDTDVIIQCDDPNKTCVAIRQAPPTKSGTLVSFSVAIREDEVDPLIQQGLVLPFLPTNVKYNTSGLSREFGKRILKAYENNTTDPMELRKRTFMGIERRTCPFGTEKEATEVPLGLLYGIIAAWILSFATFGSTLFLRRSIFYDMSDPLHWAQRTYRHVDEPVIGNPVVTSVYEHGERLMYVSGSASSGDDLLSRMRSIGITWPWKRRGTRGDSSGVDRQQPQVERQQPQVERQEPQVERQLSV